MWQSEAKGEPTGKAGWPTGGGYAHPILIDIGGQKQLIVLGGDAIYAMDPKDGRTIWKQTWETSYDVNATTPIFQDSDLFISSGYNHGSEMLKLTATEATKVWEEKSIQCRFPGIVLDRGVLYVNSRADSYRRRIGRPERFFGMRRGLICALAPVVPSPASATI